MYSARWQRQTGYFNLRNIDRRFRDAVFLGLGAHPKSLRFIDTSLYHNHGELFPSVAAGPVWEWAAPIQRWALRFAGIDDAVHIPSTTILDGTAFTLSAWVYSIQADAQKAIFSNYSPGVLFETDHITGNGVLIAIGTSAFGFATAGITHGVWQHWCAVYDGAGATDAEKLKVFINGQELALSYSTTIPTSIDSANQLYIGASPDAQPRFFTGLIADPIILPRPASPAEISLLANPAFSMVRPLRHTGWFGPPLALGIPSHVWTLPAHPTEFTLPEHETEWALPE